MGKPSNPQGCRSLATESGLAKERRLTCPFHARLDGGEHGFRGDIQLPITHGEGVAVDRYNAPSGGAYGEADLADGELGVFPFGSHAVVPRGQLSAELIGNVFHDFLRTRPQLEFGVGVESRAKLSQASRPKLSH